MFEDVYLSIRVCAIIIWCLKGEIWKKIHKKSNRNENEIKDWDQDVWWDQSKYTQTHTHESALKIEFIISIK